MTVSTNVVINFLFAAFGCTQLVILIKDADARETAGGQEWLV
jgi:hypothetical protein